ncbi:MAG TPA: hypothetical protein VGN82_04625 [Bosea sp. (in: a-proteobacteria)]|jgi:hypothetical protein|uniref:hypothetical protein n=1 Tax=Bosea sp. (in: a-proteobacteria) TaxID=1871050 RepID=UPI002E13FA8C|nr:hypothetical protein [Bosea sp. (in: a-proteobacteria)]
MTTARLLVLGVWVCGVTLLSGHLALTWRAETPPAPEAAFFEGLEYEETPLLHVPIIANGEVQGYVAAQFVFTADARTLRQMTVKPHPYVRDEALRAIYSNANVDFSRLERADIDAVLKSVKAGVNGRLGGDLVKDVLVKEFNYVRKDQLRG